MSKEIARQEAKPQTIEVNSPIFIELTDHGKKDCLRILHVDDDHGLLEVSKQILLMENNFEIENASSVDEANQKMDKQTYDAIVSDYEMPQKNGLDFLKELREQKRDIPFILFTGKGREDVVVKALNLGADSYINKNGSPETVYCELADAINKTVERKKSREMLARSDSKYRTLVENSLQGISILMAAPLRMVFANEAMGKILGYSRQELMSLSPEAIMGLVYHEDRKVFFKRMEDRLQGEQADACFEFRAVRKDASIIWLSALSNRVDYEGQPAVQGMFLDVNETKKAAEILRESEQKYRELANSLPDIVFESDPTGKLIFVNERALEIAGYSNEDFEKGLNILQFLAPEDRERAMASIQRLLAGGSYVPAEYIFLRKDGTTFPALITTTLRISQNKVTGLRGLVIDITERKKAEGVVRKSEQRYRELANALPEIVFETDLTGKITFFSQRALEISGFSKEELEKGMNMLSFVVAEERGRAMENMKKSMTGEEPGASEYTLLRKNGTTYPALVRTNPIVSENKVIGLRGLALDISDRKKVEQELHDKERTLLQNEEKLANILAVSPYAITVTDLEGKIVECNPVALEMHGYSSKEELIGKSALFLVAERDRKLALESVKKTFEKGLLRNLEYTLVCKDGHEFVGELSTSTLKNSSGKPTGFVTITIDITERKKVEEVLRENEAYNRNLINGMKDTVWVIDSEGNFIDVNDAAVETLEYSKEELLSLGIKGIDKCLNQEQVKNLMSCLPIVGTQIFETVHTTKGGKEIPVEISSSLVTYHGKQAVLNIARNITSRKKAENELKKNQSRMEIVNEKLHVVGGLTRHDVGNKLMIIRSNAFLLKKQIGDNPKCARYLEDIDSAISSSDRLFEFSRLYEKIGAEELSRTDVAGCFNQASFLFPNLGVIKIVNECQGLEVLADSLLMQLFYNLIDNSLKHGEKVTQIRLHYSIDGDGVKLFYEDDGVGISDANKPRLFDAGFTTGKGSGLGLHLIRKMVEVYGWTITEEGERGKGAKFVIAIPKT